MARQVRWTVSGRTDLPNDYERGSIKLKIRPGLTITGVLALHGLTGRYRYLSPPPFSAYDVAVGIDRNYWVEVPTGLEKRYTAELARFTSEIEWVIYEGTGRRQVIVRSSALTAPVLPSERLEGTRSPTPGRGALGTGR